MRYYHLAPLARARLQASSRDVGRRRRVPRKGRRHSYRESFVHESAAAVGDGGGGGGGGCTVRVHRAAVPAATAAAAVDAGSATVAVRLCGGNRDITVLANPALADDGGSG